MDRLSVIKKRFASKFIKTNPEWLEGCICWSVAEDPSVSMDSLFQSAYDQWLLADLKEVGIPCLPNTLFTDGNAFEFKGNCVLQMNFVLDISESPYDQLRAMHNRQLDSTDEEIEQRQRTKKKNRALRLELTDGSRILVAIEHRPIAMLSTKLVPGCKILLKGPIKCINKILFLVPGTIELLGGELDTLLVMNAYENILLRKLNQPIKSNPIQNYMEPSVSESGNDSDRLQCVNTYRPANFTKSSEAGPVVVSDPFDEPMDEDFLAIVEEQERNSTISSASGGNAATTVSNNHNPVNSLVPSDLLDFIDTSAFLNDDDPFDLDSIQSGMDVEQHRREDEIFQSNYEYRFESSHMTTIDQIQEKEIEAFRGKTMILKVKFEAVVEKLRFIGSEATMSITTQDCWSRGKLRLKLSTEVMDSLLIYDTKELKEMFKNIQRQPQVRDEIQVALDDLKRKIENLNSFIKVNYCHTDGFVLLEILKANPGLGSQFTKKIKNERLVVVK